MAGYIGTRARKRTRNFYTLLSIIFVFGLIIYFFPYIENNKDNLRPEDVILPGPNEDISSLSSTIADLNLSIFQKDQKIKFRDEQLNKLKKEISNLKISYENIQVDYSNLKEEYNNFIESNSEKKNTMIT